MNKVALITGAAKRVGAVIAKCLHQANYNVILHYHRSSQEANLLCTQLNNSRKNSATLVQGDISHIATCQEIIDCSYSAWKRLDVLINNASSFYPTKIGHISENDWQDLLGSNLKGPLFLCQAAAEHLKNVQGAIINLVDIHSEKPLKNYTVYCIAKAGLVMLTKSMARELAPDIRVNAVAPGAILWPNEANTLTAEAKAHIIDRTLLKRKGKPDDIANMILFLIDQQYVTGQVIAVDGGRSIKD